MFSTYWYWSKDYWHLQCLMHQTVRHHHVNVSIISVLYVWWCWWVKWIISGWRWDCWRWLHLTTDSPASLWHIVQCWSKLSRTASTSTGSEIWRRITVCFVSRGPNTESSMWPRMMHFISVYIRQLNVMVLRHLKAFTLLLFQILLLLWLCH